MYTEAWRAIADRIRGLAEAAELHKNYPQDSFGRAKGLRVQVEGVLSNIASFRDRFRETLPPEASPAVDDLLKQIGDLIAMATGGQSGPPLRDEAVFSAVFHLCTFASEMAAILADVQLPLRALSERAFQHLQRLIGLAPEKWRVPCEQ